MLNLHIFFSFQLRADNERYKVGSLSGYKFIFEENAMDNGRINPKNKCFCRHGKFEMNGKFYLLSMIVFNKLFIIALPPFNNYCLY